MIYNETYKDVMDYILTIVTKLKILGSDGETYLWFVPWRQYQYSISEEREVDSKSEEAKISDKKRMVYYKTTVDSIDYWLPEAIVAFEHKIRTETQQDIRVLFDSMVQQVPQFLVDKYGGDYRKMVEELLGINLNESRYIKYSGQWLWDYYAKTYNLRYPTRKV